MRILLIGEYYSMNTGDPLLCHTVKKILQDRYPQGKIIPLDLSGYTGPQTVFDPGIMAWPARIFLKLEPFLRPWLKKSPVYRAYQADEGRCFAAFSALDTLLSKETFDLAVFAGGSLFMDYFSPVICYYVKRMKKYGVKVIFHACGMGSMTESGKQILETALQQENVVHISLRDNYDRFRSTFSPSCPVTETYDTALLCSELFEAAPFYHHDYGFGVIDIKEVYDLQLSVVRELLRSGLDWRLFTNGSTQDEKTALSLLEEVGVAPEAMKDYLVPRPLSGQDLLNTVTGFSNIVTFRMHSAIAAFSFGIPAAAAAWDMKILELYRKMHIEQAVLPAEGSLSLDRCMKQLPKDGSVLRERAVCYGRASKDSLLQAVSEAMKERDRNEA